MSKSKLIRISHSSINTNNQCPRKKQFEELRLFHLYGSIAMRYGSGFHKGMEHYYKNNKNLMIALEEAAKWWRKPTVQLYNEDYRNLQSLLNSIALYHEQYKNDGEETIGVNEEKIHVIIKLTDEEKRIYGDFEVDLVVIIDLILNIDHMLWVGDFKTTSVGLAYMASRLTKLVQLMGYQFVARENYENIIGTMIYYHQLTSTKSRKTGEYGAVRTDFMKFPQIYSERDYANWRRYIIWNAWKLDKAKEAGFPPDFAHCYDFNKSCEYMPLCDHPRWDLDRFMEREDFVVVPDDRRKRMLQTTSLPLCERAYHIL